MTDSSIFINILYKTFYNIYRISRIKKDFIYSPSFLNKTQNKILKGARVKLYCHSPAMREAQIAPCVNRGCIWPSSVLSHWSYGDSLVCRSITYTNRHCVANRALVSPFQSSNQRPDEGSF